MIIRIVFLFLFLTSGFLSKSQETRSSYIDSLISKGTCNCLSSIISVRFENFETCVLEAMSKDTVALKLEVLRVMGDMSDESMYKYGYQVSKRLLVEMIAECDVFYHLFDTLRREGLTEMSVDSLSKAVNDAKPKVGEKPNGQYYFTLGVLNARQEKWSDGLAALEEALKLDPSNEAYLFFKAFTLENLARFDESILLYEQLAVKFNKPEYFIFSAIVKRLKAEKVK